MQSLSFKTERRVATVHDPNATSYCRILALCGAGRSQGRRERGREWRLFIARFDFKKKREMWKHGGSHGRRCYRFEIRALCEDNAFNPAQLFKPSGSLFRPKRVLLWACAFRLYNVNNDNKTPSAPPHCLSICLRSQGWSLISTHANLPPTSVAVSPPTPLTLSPPLNIPLRFHFLLPYRFRSDTPQLENKGGWTWLRRGGLQEESLRGVTGLIRERFTYRDNERIERRMRKGGGRQRQNENLHCRVLITTWLKQA